MATKRSVELREGIHGTGLSALAESIEFIQSSLTYPFGFQGPAPHLIIDELQFLLGVDAISVIRGKRDFSNLLPSEKQFLAKRFFGSPVARQKEFGKTLVNVYELESKIATAQDFPLVRSILEQINYRCEYTTTVSDFSIRLYASSPEQYNELQSPSVLQYLQNCLELLGRTGLRWKGQTATLPSFGKLDRPHYLKKALELLKVEVLDTLANRQTGFALYKDNPFLLEFFTVVDNLGPNIGRLKFFPIDNQSEILQDPVTVAAIRDQYHIPAELSPSQMLSEYEWTSHDSFAGLCAATRSSLLVRDWSAEQIRRGGEEYILAREIMRYVQPAVPDLMAVPLESPGGLVGVLQINCPRTIVPFDALWVVRMARRADWAIYSYAKLDDFVKVLQNYERERAEWKTYRFAAVSRMHEEGTFLNTIGTFLDFLRTDSPALSADDKFGKYESALSWMISDRRQEMAEFDTWAESGKRIDPEKIFTQSGWVDQTSIIQALDRIRSRLASERFLISGPEFGEGFSLNCRLPRLESRVVERILRNLLVNSESAAKRAGLEVGMAKVSINVELRGESSALLVAVDDNCGGLSREMPQGEITVDSWIKYCEATKLLNHGLGFFIISRYAASTGGSFTVNNIKSQKDMGVRAEVQLPLIELPNEMV